MHTAYLSIDRRRVVAATSRRRYGVCRHKRCSSFCRYRRRLGHAYEPDAAVWNLTPHGPFGTVEELASSPLMRPLADGLRFTVVRRSRTRGCLIMSGKVKQRVPGVSRVDAWPLEVFFCQNFLGRFEDIHVLSGKSAVNRPLPVRRHPSSPLPRHRDCELQYHHCCNIASKQGGF